jgi:hypothetical protein
MVSPEMVVLSVFITPWIKPKRIHEDTVAIWRSITPWKNSR